MTSFYIASGWSNKDNVRELAKALVGLGWEWIYDWTKHQEGDNPIETATAEIDGVKNADLLVVLLPGGFGTHVELGAALGVDKPVILCGKSVSEILHNDCIGYFHPNLWWIQTFGRSIGTLASVIHERWERVKTEERQKIVEINSI